MKKALNVNETRKPGLQKVISTIIWIVVSAIFLYAVYEQFFLH